MLIVGLLSPIQRPLQLYEIVNALRSNGHKSLATSEVIVLSELKKARKSQPFLTP